jgi:hypothetical protein
MKYVICLFYPAAPIIAFFHYTRVTTRSVTAIFGGGNMYEIALELG